jgi:cell division protein FtsQ
MTTPVRERGPLVDPRLQARRREIRRHEGRRRLRRLQTGLATLAVGGAGWGLVLSPVFDVDRVEVHGALRSGADEVEAAMGIEAGEAMLTLRLGQAAAAVQALPWVETATVVRHWPGVVGVTVTERRPLALVAADGGDWVVVDGAGRQLALGDEQAFPELVRVVGLELRPQLGATLAAEAFPALELADLLSTRLPGVVAEVAVTEGRLDLALPARNGPKVPVRFGDRSGLAAKVDALAVLLDAGVMAERPPPRQIDVRVPDAPVLTRSGG